MIRRSLKSFFKKHKDAADLNLTLAEKDEIKNWLDRNDLHSILRSQITMNPIPKRIQKGKTQSDRAQHETHYIKEASERVSQSPTESSLDYSA